MSQKTPNTLQTPPNRPGGFWRGVGLPHVLWIALGVVIGIFVGLTTVFLLVNFGIILLNAFVGEEQGFTQTAIDFKRFSLGLGLILGIIGGFVFAVTTPHPASPFIKEEDLTPQQRALRAQYSAPLLIRRVMWGVAGFFLGSLPGGLVGSLFVTLFFTVLGAAANDDLTNYSEWIKVRFFIVVASMGIGGLLGMIVAVPLTQSTERTELDEEGRPRSASPLTAPSATTSLTQNLSDSFRYIGLLFSNTVSLLLPSPVISTQKQDDTYIKKMTKTFNNLLTEAERLEPSQRLNAAQLKAIEENWIPQIEWTGNRANRERDANEMISWWQIILAAFIPFIASFESIAGIRSTAIMAILGIFVTILTGLLRFRRPEERWKHYRRLTENYQSELWNYITLTGPYSGFQTHKDAFIPFNDKMTLLRENDVRVFLGEVASNTTPAEDIRKANEAAVFAQQNAANTAKTTTTILPPDENGQP